MVNDFGIGITTVTFAAALVDVGATTRYERVVTGFSVSVALPFVTATDLTVDHVEPAFCCSLTVPVAALPAAYQVTVAVVEYADVGSEVGDSAIADQSRSTVTVLVELWIEPRTSR
jgi:hypothetical protein